MSAAAMRWIVGPDTGTSSKAIWSHMMTGGPSGETPNASHPHDIADFGRCYRLLALVPEWAPRIGEMARHSAEWAALTDRWTELAAMFAPLADAFAHRRVMTDTDRAQGDAMYAVMRDILDNARVCADCGKRGMSSWSTYPGDVKLCYDCVQGAKGEPASTTVQMGNATMEFSSGKPAVTP